MEIVSRAIGNDGVAGVVATLGAAAEAAARGEDVDEFAFAFVAPDGAEDDGDHFCWWGGMGEVVLELLDLRTV